MFRYTKRYASHLGSSRSSLSRVLPRRCVLGHGVVTDLPVVLQGLMLVALMADYEERLWRPFRLRPVRRASYSTAP